MTLQGEQGGRGGVGGGMDFLLLNTKQKPHCLRHFYLSSEKFTFLIQFVVILAPFLCFLAKFWAEK